MIPLKLNLTTFPTTDATITICGNLTSPKWGTFYFLIQRIENFENYDPSFYGSGDKVFLGILCGLYLLESLMITMLVLWNVKNVFVIVALIPLGLFTLVRFIFFLLVLTNVFSPGKSPTGQFVVVEIGTLLYLAGFLIYVFLWFISIKTLQKGRSINTEKPLILKLIFLIFISLALFLVAFLLAFNFVSDDVSYSCQGRIYDVTQKRKIVKIVYRSLIVACATLISFLFVISAFHFFSLMKDKQNRDPLARIALITAVCVVCFMINAITLIVLEIVEYSSVVFTFLILLFVEVVPVAVLVLVSLNTIKDKLMKRFNFSQKRPISTSVTEERASVPQGSPPQ
eukprot:TRINITY_DN3765_c0_g1_i2.p1 TRINITY_DN3765_c0_g1~~TRINITY_DN3765_c0_g1_i2.p1  ORF type:complete len:378 (+),score=101.72 TRINITY_DN3765_c0_g1_i2:114-1136(+)